MITLTELNEVGRHPTEEEQMAFDAGLVERIRDRLADRPGVADKPMFGTLAFLTDGNLLVCVRGDDLLVRLGRDDVGDALTRPGARQADMAGRPMTGWVQVDGAALDDEALAEWIGRACDFVGTLPPKSRPH